MSHTKTTIAPPVYLSLASDVPKPAKGCGVCAALVKQRDAAAKNGSGVTVQNCNDELRNHPHRRAGDGDSP
ncbi:hypothetical protein AB4212_00895 [Streptomyces sp. 2MCAF27]